MKSFDLWPNLIKNTKGMENFSNNPDKQHYLDRDIFTYISYANILDKQRDTSGFKTFPVALHDTIYYSKGMMILDTCTGQSIQQTNIISLQQIRPSWPGSG